MVSTIAHIRKFSANASEDGFLGRFSVYLLNEGNSDLDKIEC
jgi:hypothetical protein